MNAIFEKQFLIIFLIICSGFIFVPCISQSSIDFDLTKQFLNFPVSYDEEEHVKLELIVGNEAVRIFDIFLPDSEPDFWVFLDVGEFNGKKAKLRTEHGDEKKGLNLIYQSDERSYLNNVYQEKLRPQLHFSTQRGWINDPNGLIYFDGEYHLFYQHNPYGFDWGNMHWGHAVSKDLLHWKQLPEALYPDDVGVCFSGSAVIDYNNTSRFKKGEEDVMVAVYTSTFFPTDAQEEDGMVVMERQSVAYSNDKGRTWTKYKGNPVIGNRQDILKSWNDRDPNVFWHQPTGKWVMILFEKIGLSIFSSSNLKDWKHESYMETFWECPELLELPVDGDDANTKWVVYDAGGDYVIGSFDGKKFTIENGAYTYIVGDFFAAQCFENIPEDDGRCIQIGWSYIPSDGMPFNGMMAFPTELTLRTTHDGIRLFNEPISEISRLHAKSHVFSDLSVQQAKEIFKSIDAELLHIEYEIDNTNIMNYGLNIGDDRLGYSIRTNEFFFNGAEEKVYKYRPELSSNQISFELIVDRISIEVFVDEGRFTMVLPRNLESDKQGLEFWTDNGTELTFKSLKIHEMKSIWDQ